MNTKKSKISKLIDDAIELIETDLSFFGKHSRLLLALKEGAEHLHRFQDESDEAMFLQAAIGKRSISFQKSTDEKNPIFFATYSAAPEGLETTDHITVFLDWQNERDRERASKLLRTWMLSEASISELKRRYPIQ